jgi:hypothetical protein
MPMGGPLSGRMTGKQVEEDVRVASGNDYHPRHKLLATANKLARISWAGRLPHYVRFWFPIRLSISRDWSFGISHVGPQLALYG